MSGHVHFPTARFAESWPASASLRHALVALAAEAELRRNPRASLAHVRPLVDRALAEIEANSRVGDEVAGNPSAIVRLANSAIVGLLHFARVASDPDAPSMVAPVARVALGNYAARLPQPRPRGSLLILLDEHADERARGERIADFVAQGLIELGVQIVTVARTPGDCVTLADILPAFRGLVHKHRFVCGRYGLYTAFSRAVIEHEKTTLRMAPAA